MALANLTTKKKESLFFFSCFALIATILSLLRPQNLDLLSNSSVIALASNPIDDKRELSEIKWLAKNKLLIFSSIPGTNYYFDNPLIYTPSDRSVSHLNLLNDLLTSDKKFKPATIRPSPDGMNLLWLEKEESKAVRNKKGSLVFLTPPYRNFVVADLNGRVIQCCRAPLGLNILHFDWIDNHRWVAWVCADLKSAKIVDRKISGDILHPDYIRLGKVSGDELFVSKPNFFPDKESRKLRILPPLTVKERNNPNRNWSDGMQELIAPFNSAVKGAEFNHDFTKIAWLTVSSNLTFPEQLLYSHNMNFRQEGYVYHLWVSDAHARHLVHLGSFEPARDSAAVPQFVLWQPGDQNLSFQLENKIYLIPANGKQKN